MLCVLVSFEPALDILAKRKWKIWKSQTSYYYKFVVLTNTVKSWKTSHGDNILEKISLPNYKENLSNTNKRWRIQMRSHSQLTNIPFILASWSRTSFSFSSHHLDSLSQYPFQYCKTCHKGCNYEESRGCNYVFTNWARIVSWISLVSISE